MKKRVLSLFLAFTLCFSMLPTAALAEEAGVVQDAANANSTYTAGEDAGLAGGEDGSVPDGTDGGDADSRGEAQDGKADSAVSAVQELIDALPDEVTAENAETVAEQLTAIDAALEALTAEQLTKVDLTHYETVCTALAELPAVQEDSAEAGTHTAHCVCGKDSSTTVNGHEHDSAATEWNAATSLPDSAGSYYLTQPVTSNWTVPTGEVKLCLNGQTIDGSITVGSGATLTLTDCTNNGKVQGEVTVNGGTLELYGGTISGGVQVGMSSNPASGSAFTMYGGAISGHNASSGSGGGVFLVGTTNSSITAPSFTMHGGTISNNTAGASDGGGGGVYVGQKCSFTMDGGTISGNMATAGNGGGIYIHYNAGTVSISNATITDNKATATGNVSYGLGGGIYTQKGLTVSNSTITGNEAAYYGGGICGTGSITLNSTVVTDNKSTQGNGGGVYASKMDSTLEGTKQPLSVSGSTKISGNAPNNYHVNEDRQLPIQVTGTLSNDAVICVDVIGKFKPGYGKTLTIAEPANGVTLNANNFKADAGDCVTSMGEDGKVYLARCAHEMDDTGYTCSKCKTQFDARVGESNYYQTLTEAFSETEGGTVTLLRDVTLNANCSAATNYNTTLDLNGKTITTSKDYPINVGGGNKAWTLTVKDSGTNSGAQALTVKLLVRSNGTLAVDNSYTGDISCVELQAGGALECFGGKIGELVLSNAASGYTGTGGYGLKLWKNNASACTIGKITDNTASKALTVNDLLGTDYAKCELYGEKDDTWSIVSKTVKISELDGYTAYKVQFPECVHECSDDSKPVCSKCGKELYTKITAKAAGGETKTAYFAADSTLENGYAEAIQALNRWGTTGYTDLTLTLLRDMPSGSSMTLTGTLTLAGGTHTAHSVTVDENANMTFASGNYKGATINGTATVENGVTFTDDANVMVNGRLNVKGGTFTGVVKFEKNSTVNISGGSFTNDKLHLGVTFNSSVTGTISGGTFKYAEFHATGVKLSDGKFEEISISGGDKLADLLAEGAAYYNSDNSAVSNDKVTSLTNVTVESHEHNGGTDGSGICSICKKQMTASLTVGSKTSWYVAFTSAIEAANAADGEKTITLYQDVNGYNNNYTLTRGPVTLATGEKTLQYATLIAKGISLTVTGKGSGGSFNVTADGKDAELNVSNADTKLAYVTAKNGGKLSLSNGTFSGVKVTDDGSSASLSGGTYSEIMGDNSYVKPYALLAKGHAYKKTTDNKWVSNANITLQKVTVEKAPFAVEKIYPNDETDYTGSSAIAANGSITLTAVITPDTEGVAYEWELLRESDNSWLSSTYFYKVNEAAHTGAGSKTLSISGLPDNSSYQYRVLVRNSDGYQCYSEPFTVTRHQHSWTYTADNTTHTITATCSDCHVSGGSVTLKAPEATDGKLTYDGKDQPATLENNLQTGATPTITYSKQGKYGPETLENGALPKNANTYTATLHAGDKSVSVDYTINKADLTVKAKDATITYGDTAVSKGVTYNGFVNGETESVLGGELTYTFSYTPGMDVGNFIITPAGKTSGNYDITFQSGKLTVEPREVTLTWAGYEDRTAGDGKAVTATAGNLYSGDVIGVELTGNAMQTSGTHTAKATGLTGAKAGNYKLPANVTQKYTIGLAKQELTFVKNDNLQSVNYGDTYANPATNNRADGGKVTYTSSDDTIATVDENGVVTAKKVGRTTITATAAAVDGKYTEAKAEYILLVNKRPITLDIDPITVCYGEANPLKPTPTPKITSGSLAFEDTIADLKLSWATAGATANVGKYKVNCYVGNDNYDLTFDGENKLTITQRPITVEVDAVSRVYGERNPNFTANTVTKGSLVTGDMLVLTLTTTADETSPVGSYDVTLLSSGSPNYAVTVLGEKKLTVTAKPITVTVNEASRAYGSANPTFTATAPSGALVGDDTIESLNLTLSTDATKTSDVGKYDVTGSANNANYTVTVEGTDKLTVTKKELTADDLEFADTPITKVYDGKLDAAVTVQIKDGAKVKAEDVLPTVTGTGTYNSKDVKDANKVTFVSAKTESANYILPAGLTVEHEASITKRVISIKSVTTTPKQFDGDTNAWSCITDVSFENLVSGETLIKSGIYNGSYVTGDYGVARTAFNSANVNEANTITGIVGIINNRLNYTFVNAEGEESSIASFTTNGEITKANARDLGTAQLKQRYTDTAVKEYLPDYTSLMPANAGNLTYDVSYEVTQGTADVKKNDKEESTGKLTYQIEAQAGAVITWTFTVHSTNYADSTHKLVVTITDREQQTDFRFENNTTAKTATYGDADFTIPTTGAATGSSVTYESSNPDVATVDENGKVTIKAAGTATIKAKATETADFEEKDISYTLTVKPKTLTKDDLTHSGSITKVYDGSTNAPSSLTISVKPTSLVGSDTLAVSGTLKFNSANVGEASEITFTPTAITTGNYTLAATETLTIRSASITAKEVTLTSGINATNRCYAKDNKTVVLTKGTLTIAGLVGSETLDINIPATGTISDATVGTYNVTYSGVTLKDGTTSKASNYKLVDSLPTVTVTISKAAAPVLADIPVSFKYTVTTGEKAIGSVMPDDAGTLTYSKGTESKTGSVTVTSWAVDPTTGKVTYTLSNGAANDTVTLPVTIVSTNYEDATVKVKITLTARDNQAELRVTGGTTVVYGQTLTLSTSGGSGTGAVTYTVTNGTGEATIDPNGVLTPVRVGSVTVTAAKEGDSEYNAVTSSPVEITITKATPTGTPKYTEITTSGKTLKDAGLTLEGSTLKPNAGTLEWIDESGNALPGNTVIEANKTYMWRFMPTDGNYTVLTGSIELYHKSSSGGGGWYYSYYTIKATAGASGSISPTGWTSVREGWDQTFTITPDKGYAVAKVLVDGKSVGAVTSYTFKNVTKDHTIEAVFMKSNGNPQTGVFVDVPENSYYEEAVNWAVENGITNGVSSDRFDPDGLCTRAQIVTFLWRAAGSPAPKSTSHNFTDVKAGSYYEQAVLWAVENGITVGTSSTTFSPDATCTRAQAVTFLYRASGSPAVSGSAAFSDVAADAYYADAVSWAEKKGITTGIGGGLFGSNNDCTRAQIVTFLWRAMAE